MSECPLCRLAQGLDRITQILYEDDKAVACFCKSHPDKVIIVLKHHTRYPMPQEQAHLELIASTKFPDKKFRGPRSILDHYHMHEI